MWGSESSGGRLRSRPWVLESFHGCWRWFTGLGRPPTLFAAAKGRNTGPFATEISDVIWRFARFVFPLSTRGSLDTRLGNDYESAPFAPVRLPVVPEIREIFVVSIRSVTTLGRYFARWSRRKNWEISKRLKIGICSTFRNRLFQLFLSRWKFIEIKGRNNKVWFWWDIRGWYL